MRTWNQHQAEYRIKVCLPFGGRDKQTGYLDGYANCHKEDILKGYWESLTGISSKVKRLEGILHDVWVPGEKSFWGERV